MINQKAERKVYGILAVLIAVLVGFYFSKRNSSPQGDSTVPQAQPPVAKSVTLPMAVSQSKPVMKIQPSPQPRNTSNNAIERIVVPDLETLRTEVEADPHTTPPSLIAFANEMAAAMDEAKTDEQKGGALLKRLDECVTEPGPTAARAVCLENAKRLGKMYPVLQSLVEDLKKKTPVEVSRLLPRD